MLHQGLLAGPHRVLHRTTRWQLARGVVEQHANDSSPIRSRGSVGLHLACAHPDSQPSDAGCVDILCSFCPWGVRACVCVRVHPCDACRALQAAPEPKPLPLHVQVAAREVMTGRYLHDFPIYGPSTHPAELLPVCVAVWCYQAVTLVTALCLHIHAIGTSTRIQNCVVFLW